MTKNSILYTINLIYIKGLYIQKVSIGNLQKNISLLTKTLACKYKNRLSKTAKSLQEIKEETLTKAFGAEYGLSN